MRLYQPQGRALKATLAGLAALCLLVALSSMFSAHRAAETRRAALMQRGSLSDNERRAVKESKLRARLAVQAPSSLSAMDAKIAEFKASIGNGGQASHRVTNLVGDYVMNCEKGGNCEKWYVPEDDKHFKDLKPTVKEVDNAVGLPFGDAVDAPVDHYNRPEADIVPKYNRLGAHWLSFGANDRFVAKDDSGISPRKVQPVWRRDKVHEADVARREKEEKSFKKVEANTQHLHCPGDPVNGKDCLTDSDGVDGVYEATFFSDGVDDTGNKLKTKGVNVDTWPVPAKTEIHHWDRQAVDHPPKAGSEKEIKWEEMKDPQWAYDNAAMRSLGWDPEGEKNKELMLGPWGERVKKDFGDYYLDKNDYSHQIEVESDYKPLTDHFADWKPDSEKNQRLLYGTSHMTKGMRWSPKLHAYVKDEWTLFSDEKPADKAAEELVGREGQARLGEPFGDAITGTGWGGTNMIASSENNLNAREGKPYVRKVPKLERMGVNTGET